MWQVLFKDWQQLRYLGRMSMMRLTVLAWAENNDYDGQSAIACWVANQVTNALKDVFYKGIKADVDRSSKRSFTN